MNNIDVSKVSLYSEFPPLVDYQEALIQFNLPSNAIGFTDGVPAFQQNIYDQTHSTPLDKASGIADVTINYDGMRAVGSPTGTVSSGSPPAGGDFKEDITWNVRSTVSDFCSSRQDYMVSGKNVSFIQMGVNPSSTITNVSDRYYALNFFVWFESGILYCRCTLDIGHPGGPAYTARWEGGVVTLNARVSLLPY